MDYKEKVIALLNSKELTKEQKEKLKEIFPELAEPEDERIRKAIHIYLDWLDGRNKDYQPKGDYSIKDMIAWLEKQGEPIEINPTEFDTRLQNLIGKFDNLPKEELIGSLSFWMNVVQNDGTYKSDEKQGEQKPVVIIPKFRIGDNIKTTNEEPLTITKIDGKGYWSEDLFVCDFDDAAKWELVEQKPAWSEEDERLCQCLIEDQEEALDAVRNDKYGHSEIISDLKEMYHERIDWLESLKQRMGEQ